MKLRLLLPLAALIVSCVLAGTPIAWENADCDKKVGATTAKECCKAPPIKNYTISIVAPHNGSCVNYSGGTVPLFYQATESKDKNYTEPDGPAFLLYLTVNLPEDSPQYGENSIFTSPVCFGDGSEALSADYPVNKNTTDLFKQFKYFTWGYNLISMPNATDFVTVFSSEGVTNTTGIWISEDCTKLEKDICAGKIPDPQPKDNPFYKEAMSKCGGGSGSSHNKGGSGGRGSGGSGDGGQDGKGSAGGGSGSGSCTKDHKSKHKCKH